MNTLEQVRELLAQLEPEVIELTDDSAAHAGHAGAAGGGHYRLFIVSQAFDGQNAVRRHRMIYQILEPLMHGAVHALSIKALTPHEAAQDASL